MTLKEMVDEAVMDIVLKTGRTDCFHPELGLIVKDGKATHALIAFFKKYERKMSKSVQTGGHSKK